MSRAELKIMIRCVGDLLSRNDFDTLDNILKAADWQTMSDDMVAGLPRSTAVAKLYLPSWHNARDEAVKELDRRNLDSKRIMHGLL